VNTESSSLFPDGYTDWTWGELEDFARDEIEKRDREIEQLHAELLRTESLSPEQARSRRAAEHRV
jgi:hypothetical protein